MGNGGKMDPRGHQATRPASSGPRRASREDDSSRDTCQGSGTQGQGWSACPSGPDSREAEAGRRAVEQFTQQQSPVGYEFPARTSRCPGCEALEKQVAYLQQLVQQSQDRLLAVANPAGYQIYKGVPVQTVPVSGAPGTEAVELGVDGQQYVIVGAQRVPIEEYRAQMERLEEQMSGRSGTIPGNQGSEGTGGLMI